MVWTWLYLDQAFIDRLLNLPVGMANAHNEPLVTPGWGFWNSGLSDRTNYRSWSVG